MTVGLIIRSEKAEDCPAIHEVHAAAFGRENEAVLWAHQNGGARRVLNAYPETWQTSEVFKTSEVLG